MQPAVLTTHKQDLYAYCMHALTRCTLAIAAQSRSRDCLPRLGAAMDAIALAIHNGAAAAGDLPLAELCLADVLVRVLQLHCPSAAATLDGETRRAIGDDLREVHALFDETARAMATDCVRLLFRVCFGDWLRAQRLVATSRQLSLRVTLAGAKSGASEDDARARAATVAAAADVDELDDAMDTTSATASLSTASVDDEVVAAALASLDEMEAGGARRRKTRSSTAAARSAVLAALSSSSSLSSSSASASLPALALSSSSALSSASRRCRRVRCRESCCGGRSGSVRTRTMRVCK